MKIKNVLFVALTAALIASGGVTSSIVTASLAQATTTPTLIDVAVNQIFNDTNAARAANGLAPLRFTPTINTVAQNWSESMAAKHSMTHNPDFAYQIPTGWSRAGENVAQGYQPTTVVTAWMNSEGHRANILGDYTHIGVGYAVDGSGRGWYTQNFGKYKIPDPQPADTPNIQATPTSITSSWVQRQGRTVTWLNW